MNKSIIVYGPQGCGKTRYAERIAKHFGLTIINDADDPRQLRDFHRMKCLLLTSTDKATICAELMLDPSEFNRVLSFAEVAQQINAAIPLTDWFPTGTKPAKIGEYNASYYTSSITSRRWWNGLSWSCCWYPNEDEEEKARCKDSPGIAFGEITWRGLAEEPIVVQGGA